MSSVSDIIDVITRELCEFCSNYEWLTQLNKYLNEWEALQHTGHMSKEKKPKDIEVCNNTCFVNIVQCKIYISCK